MDFTEPINSTLEDKLIVHQNTRLEKEKAQGIRNVVEQSIYEEKLANNGIYASIFMHCFIIISTLAIIIMRMNLITTNKESNPEKNFIKFSLFTFDYKLDDKNLASMSYFCFDRLRNESGSICTVAPSCKDRRQDIEMIQNKTNLNCEYFIPIRNIGIIVNR